MRICRDRDILGLITLDLNRSREYFSLFRDAGGIECEGTFVIFLDLKSKVLYHILNLLQDTLLAVSSPLQDHSI